MRPARTRYPNAKLSRPKARVALTRLLYFCTDERLKGFTAEALAASYNVPAKEVAVLLQTARQGRRL